MKRFVLILVAIAAAAQDPQEVRLEAAAPPPVQASASLVGAPGGRSVCYWVIVNYASGSRMSEPACVTNAPSTYTVSNYVRVSWSAAPGAVSYDVLRTASDAGAGTCAACAVVTGSSAQTVNDTGGALGAYTYTPARSARGQIRVENRDYAAPALVSSLPFRAPAFVGDGSGLTGVGGSGGGPLLFAPSSASGATYSGSVSGATYAEGLTILFVPDVTNSGSAPNINLNAQGDRVLYRRSGNGLTAGQLVAGRPYLIVYASGAFYLGDQDYAGDSAVTQIDYSTSPPQVKLIDGAVCLNEGSPCEPTALQDHSGAAGWLPPMKTVATLPAAAGVTGQVFMVTDAASLTSLGAGGGSTRAWFVSNGSTYSALAGAGGSSGPEETLFHDGGDIFQGTGAAQDLYSYSMPANTLQVGDVLHVVAYGAKSDVNGTATGGDDEYLMIGTGATNNPIAKTAHYVFKYDFYYKVQSATLQRIHGTFHSANAYAGIWDEDNFYTDPTFDITGAVTVKLHVAAGFGAGEYIRVDDFIVTRIRY